MDILLIIGVFQALIMASLLVAKKSKATSDYMLFSLILVYGLTLFLAFVEVYNRGNGFPFPFFIQSSTPFIFLHGPLMWFYIRSLTRQKFGFRPLHLLHFLPFLAVLLLLSKSFYWLPSDQKILMETGEVFRSDIFFPVIIVLIAISTQGYNFWGLRMLNRYKRGIESWFSKLEDVDHRWLKHLLIISIIFYSIISSLYIADYLLNLMSYDMLQIAGYSFASLFIIFIGFYGYRRGNIFSSPSISIDIEKKAELNHNTSALDQKEKEFIDSLLHWMKHQKPYLDPELTLGELASQVNASADYLSEILNGRLKRNFFDFINHYRVEEFKTRCLDQQYHNQKILSIAWDSGFNSKATFNRVFKKVTGLTPGEFQSKSR
jgi:AraC-like DNA-binding protein